MAGIARATSRLAIGLWLVTGIPGQVRAATDPPPGAPGGPAAPRPAATIRVTPPAPILADGWGSEGLAVIEVTVLDAAGRPAEEVPVGSGGKGEFREALLVEPGLWALPYRPPPVLSDTTEHVTVRAGAASVGVDLEIVIQRPAFQLGAKAGLAVAGGRLGPAVGVEAGVWTVVGRTQLGLVLEGAWWTLSSTATVSSAGAESTYRSTQDCFPVLLSLGWRTPVADAWMLWATAGGGGAAISSRVQLSGQQTARESGLAPAVSGAFSAGPRLGPGFLFLEARAFWIGDPGLLTTTGSSVTFLGILGYRFDVG